jgi:hypothetical protein
MIAVLMAAVLSLSFLMSYQFNQISASRKEARRQNLDTWHSVICTIEATVVADKTVPPAKKKFELKFYDGLLMQINAEPCRLKTPS